MTPPLRLCRKCELPLAPRNQRDRHSRCRKSEIAHKPGRPKKLNGTNAALLFQLQCERAALDKRIEQILDEANYVGRSSRARILSLNWIDRGRIDVLHPSSETLTMARTHAGAEVARLRRS